MEIFSSWALFIMIMLLIAALFTSYMLQQKKVEAVHETVISIFAGKQAPDVPRPL
jgi:sodium/hydrogen exchanger-like protein 6/7